jgi:UDP-N-acetylglucosamine 2-epimerase (non-hydrolysing)
VTVVLSVVGTRPNFMKIAPIARALEAEGSFRHVLVHTGQHYDVQMSDVFFRELMLEAPAVFLEVGAGTHAQQTARVLERLEPVLADVRPDVVLVPGDVNSTLGAALAAVKAGVPVGHVEAGLRSFDRTMPEEINRVVVDQISTMLFTHSPEAQTNLVREGVPDAAIHPVGNTMIDTLIAMEDAIASAATASRCGLTRGQYLVVTLHRPALVDGPLLTEAVAHIDELADHLPVVFPLHPRTRQALERQSLHFSNPRVSVLDPMGYVAFVSLLADAAGVVTDSGGIQEESTFLKVPCFTLRSTTERPVTVTSGTNVLLGLDPARIAEIPSLLASPRPQTTPPVGWDGRAAERIAAVLAATYAGAAPATSG